MPCKIRTDRGLFSFPGFSAFFLAQSFSLVGDGLKILAIPLLVYRLTGSALSTGVSFACELVPFALCNLIAGSIADRLDRRLTMIASDAVRCGVMVIIAALLAVHHLAVGEVYAGMVVSSIAAALFLGCQTCSLPYLVGTEPGTQAVAMLSGVESVCNLFTPVVGGACLHSSDRCRYSRLSL